LKSKAEAYEHLERIISDAESPDELIKNQI
jgi:hypothetical protein